MFSPLNPSYRRDPCRACQIERDMFVRGGGSPFGNFGSGLFNYCRFRIDPDARYSTDSLSEKNFRECSVRL